MNEHVAVIEKVRVSDFEAPLYKSDPEIAKLVGLPIGEWRVTAAALERQGLPLPDPMFGGKRYWPSVRLYLDRRAGIARQSPPQLPAGKENLDVFRR